MRMTGCPNGCARPYVAEIAFIGKAPGTYSMLLGGGYYGQRLNKIYRGMFYESPLDQSLTPLCRIRDRTRNPRHPQAHDQAVCPRTTREREIR